MPVQLFKANLQKTKRFIVAHRKLSPIIFLGVILLTSLIVTVYYNLNIKIKPGNPLDKQITSQNNTYSGSILAASSENKQKKNNPKFQTITPVPSSSLSPTATKSPSSVPTPSSLQNTPTPTLKPTTITPASPVNTIPSQIKFGVVIDDYTNHSGGINEVEQQLGKTLSHISFFKHFGLSYNNSFTVEDLAYVKSRNIKVILAWEPWNPEQGLNQSIDYLKEIPEGKHDSYLKSFAASIKQYSNPIIIRFAHEMNGDWYPWGNRPEEYKKAYRHIVSVFRGEGINNVSWMWSINADNIPYSPISNAANFYPGDDVVDLIGIDGYNFGTSQNYGGWKSFLNIFRESYDFVSRTYYKPIYISETASSEVGGNKALWVDEMFKIALSNYFPKISEITWFNLNKETDWRINSSSSSLESFKMNLP